MALTQIPSVKSIATGILASSAVLGLVVGFAARQTLANGIAGVLLAITQPIRIGDHVTFEERTGDVEDVRLTYTYIRLDDGRRLIVPNESLAQSSIENHTIIDPRVQVEVSVWLPPDANLDRALELIADEDEGIDAVVAETDREDVRLERHDLVLHPRRAREDRHRSAPELAAAAQRTRSILGRGLVQGPNRRPMSHRHRQSRRRKHRGSGSKILLAIGVIATVCIIGVLSVAGYVLAIAATAPDLTELKPTTRASCSVIFASDGTRLGFVQSDILAGSPWKDMPVDMRHAIVAIEDERFYKHEGIDYNAIVRAGIKNIESGKTVQGGSTITQQLVRALYIKDPERNFERKIREAKLASELEEKHSQALDPPQLPELGPVRHGRRPDRDRRRGGGASIFFYKHAKSSSSHEAALLAGLPQAPSQYNPFRNRQRRARTPQRGAARRWTRTATSRGRGRAAAAKALGLKQGRRYMQRREPYFFDYVQEKLIEGYGVGVVPPRRPARSTPRSTRSCRRPRARPSTPTRLPGRPSSAIVSIDPADGQHPGDGLERHLRRPQLQPRRPGPPPARLGVQDDGADRRDPQGLRPRHHPLHLEAARHQRPRATGRGRSRPSATPTAAR